MDRVSVFVRGQGVPWVEINMCVGEGDRSIMGRG